MSAKAGLVATLIAGAIALVLALNITNQSGPVIELSPTTAPVEYLEGASAQTGNANDNADSASDGEPLCYQMAEDDPFPTDCPFSESDAKSGAYDYRHGAWYKR